ncbi:ATP-binding cassette domain-containing protein [Thioalkalivibrio sp. HK1]|uniref:ATP-binding cassette domain-containing protein n=1 Tax=Thioalkalivibrio sp. HK1 TaxID=1469245 RepID=UPI00046E5D09|nr:metal ABC transporter ATP-binding protein [Thioalkalivibrio sp. HK1]
MFFSKHGGSAFSAPEQDEILVQACRVSVRLGRHDVLQDVDIAVRKGEIVTLIGLNGAGKSTLIRVLLGIVRPHLGQVRRVPGLRIGYAPQHIQRDPIFPMTVRRFLTLGTKPSDRKLDSTLHDVGLLDRGILEHALAEISGGEMRRVLLARALLRKPDLLVLDEPLAGVDISSQSRLYRLIANVRDVHGCGVLLVSHDLHIVMAATDTVVCLNRHICCTGHPQVVTRDPAFVALFGAQIAFERAVYQHHHDHRHDALGEPMPPETSTDHRHGTG